MTPINRRQDWPEELAAWVERNRLRPFAWGQWDCATAAADAVLTITDVDVLGGLLWADVRGALRQLEVEGGIEAAVTARLGAPIAPAFAQRGDVVLIAPELAGWVDDAAPGAIGVCLDDRFVAPSAKGLAFISMSHALRAWKVGRG